jgi:hypothetical protein
MKFLVLLLWPFSQISRLFKTRAVFTRSIEGRHRNPAIPEQGRFPKKEAQTICEAAMGWSRQLRRTMPKRETSGGKFMTRGAVGVVAIYRGLRDCGIEHAYAIELEGDIGYQFYKSSVVGRIIDEWALVVGKVELFTVNSKSSMMKSQIDSCVIRRMI